MTIQVRQQQQQPQQLTQAQAPAPAPGTMFCDMMSQASACSNSTQQQNHQHGDEVTINGTVYTHHANITHHISKHGNLNAAGGLVDGGANGGLFGKDVKIIEYIEHAFVDVTGINDTEVLGLKLAQAAGVVQTVSNGPVVAIMSQCADLGTGKSIHSKGQLEHCGLIVEDTS